MKKMSYLFLVLSAFILCVGNACTEQRAQAGIDYNVHRASVEMAKAFRQFQKADEAFDKAEDESAEKHLAKGLDFFETALEHLSKAEDDAYVKASAEIEKGDDELEKSIEEYSEGDDEAAAKHYANALDYYDKALSIFDE